MFMLRLLWKIPKSKNYILLNFVPNNIWVGFLLRMKLILGDSTETLSGFQTQDKILDLLSTPELLFMEDFDKKKIIFLEVIWVHFLRAGCWYPCFCFVALHLSPMMQCNMQSQHDSTNWPRSLINIHHHQFLLKTYQPEQPPKKYKYRYIETQDTDKT